VGSVPPELAAALRDRLGLRRAVETGTYLGGSARLLAGLFESVVTIELSESLAARAARELADRPNVTVRQGDSRRILPELAAADVPTLYWLDGHWSGGETAGAEHECPLLEELAAISADTAETALLVDDARLFTASPPPPHDPAAWPTIVEVFDALRSARHGHHVTVLRDLVIAVPGGARDLADRFGRGELDSEPDVPSPARRGSLFARYREKR
jgi:hypothetical protein